MKLILIDHDSRFYEFFEIGLKYHIPQVEVLHYPEVHGHLKDFKEFNPDLIIFSLKGKISENKKISLIKSSIRDCPIVCALEKFDASNILNTVNVGFDFSFYKYDFNFKSLSLSLQTTIHNYKIKIEEKIKSEKQNNKNQEQIRLFSSWGHDIKNLIGVIKGYNELLRDDPKNDIEILKKQNFAIADINNLLLDMIEFSKAKSEVSTQNRSLINLNEHLNHLKEYADFLTKSRNLKLEWMVKAKGPVYLDSMKLVRILMNIISNACKYTEKGKISVRLEATDSGKLCVCVKDTGRGIPKDKLSHLREFGYQVYDKDATVGTGVGLYIVKTLVEQLNATFEIKSKVDIGTEITIKIPFELPNFINKENTTFLKNENLAGKRILLIDDDEDIKFITQRFFEPEGAEIHIASTNIEACEIMSKQKFEIIIHDYNLAEMNIFSSLDILSKYYSKTETCVILLSAISEEQLSDARASALFNGFIRKPFAKNVLLSQVNSIYAQFLLKKAA